MNSARGENKTAGLFDVGVDHEVSYLGVWPIEHGKISIRYWKEGPGHDRNLSTERAVMPAIDVAPFDVGRVRWRLGTGDPKRSPRWCTTGAHHSSQNVRRPQVSSSESSQASYYALISAGVGDYERLLVSGITGYLPRKNGMLQLERIGPFIPPLSRPSNDVIVTAEFLQVLLNSEFNNWTTVPVIKELICFSEWTPGGEVNLPGDPEDSILGGQHDQKLADQMGDLFELILPVGCVARSCKTAVYGNVWGELGYHSFNGGDLFSVQLPGGSKPVCSDRFKMWVEANTSAAQWLSFVPLKLQHA